MLQQYRTRRCLPPPINGYNTPQGGYLNGWHSVGANELGVENRSPRAFRRHLNRSVLAPSFDGRAIELEKPPQRGVTYTSRRVRQVSRPSDGHLIPGIVFVDSRNYSQNVIVSFALVFCVHFFLVFVSFFRLFQGDQDVAQPLSVTSNEAAGLDLSATDLGSAGDGLYGPLSSAMKRPREGGMETLFSFSCFLYGTCRFLLRYSDHANAETLSCMPGTYYETKYRHLSP